MNKLGFNVKEAAELLGVSHNTLYRAIWRGEVRAVKIGSRVLIAKGELERLLGYPLDSKAPAEQGGGE
jgi:excisionase family DNA binding protein